MINPANEVPFGSELWAAALEKFASATHLTVRLFDAEERAVFGPVHPTPLFQLFDEKGYDPGIFVECARRCIVQTQERPAVVVSQFHGLAVVGTSLVLEGKVVGAAVGGYAFADFSQVSEIQRLARQAGIVFDRLWDIARKQRPVPQRQLMVHGELLQVLGDALLRENYRSRQYEQAAAIVNSCVDAIISKDLDGVITSWNRGAEQLFGYTAKEAIGQPGSLLIPPERIDEEPRILERIRHGERVEHYETLRRCKDGTLRDISLTVSPTTDAQGCIVGASEIARDITERKRAEEALRESEQRFRQLAEAMPQIVWTACPDGYIDYYNDRWYEFTGFPRGEFGQSSWKPILHPNDMQRCTDTYFDCISNGKPYQVEYRFKDRMTGTYRWFMGRALPVHNEQGEIVKWFGTCTDIDDQKRAEQEIRTFNRELEERIQERTHELEEANATLIRQSGELTRSNAELEGFAYVSSHDLQEPLRMVSSFTKLLAQRYHGRLDADADEFIQYIVEGADRMQALVRDLLNYSRLTAREKRVEQVNCEILWDRTIANLRTQIDQSDAVLTHDPLPTLTGDATQLGQVFQNLISNALKFHSQDVTPRVHISAQLNIEEGWIFSVSDNGIGIEPQYAERIFVLFQRLHSRDEYSGTGVGLAICKRVVEAHGGRIWVESALAKGSTFNFTMPAPDERDALMRSTPPPMVTNPIR